MTRLITTKRLAFAVIMGAAALVMQAALPGIPLGIAGGKLELADIPAIFGASITGPIGGIICGFLYGLASPTYLALIPSMMCVLGLIGYISDKRNNWLTTVLAIIVSRVIFGPLLLAVPMKFIYFNTLTYVDTWLLCLTYAVPGALASIAVYMLILKKIPRLLSRLNENNL
jgi:riboflavin transporter FmnP